MTWHRGTMVSFDLETTGVDVETDRIVTSAIVTVSPGNAPHVWSTVIDPGVPIPDSATQVHGWTTERVQAEGRPPANDLDWMATKLADALTAETPVVIANAPFDLTILDRELRRYGLGALEDRLGDKPISPVIDVMCLDKAIDRYRKGGRKLTDLCAHYGVRMDDAHQAEADALGAARVAWTIGSRAHMDPDALWNLYGERPKQAGHIVRAFQDLGAMSLADLHEAQKGWYRESSRSLAGYFRQKANEEDHRADTAVDDAVRATAVADAEELRRRANDVSEHWPMRPWTGA